MNKIDNRCCLCGQSPININTSTVVEGMSDLKFFYAFTNFIVLDSGFFIEFRAKNTKSYLKFNNIKYDLIQLHFHNESENTIDQHHYKLEGHLVHEDDSGNLLVVSILFETDKYNNTLKNYVSKLNEVVAFNPTDLIPIGSKYYEFSGSLTTPPFSEGVKWLVFNDPLFLSQKQLEEFQDKYKNNNRNIQKLNGRMISINKTKTML